MNVFKLSLHFVLYAHRSYISTNEVTTNFLLISCYFTTYHTYCRTVLTCVQWRHWLECFLLKKNALINQIYEKSEGHPFKTPKINIILTFSYFQ